MLIEFRVSNYRSIKEEQVLSFVASTDKTHSESHLIGIDLSSKTDSNLNLVKSTVLYGPNASGKSNLISALLFMRAVVAESATLQPNQSFNVQPFRLDDATNTKPSMFEITFYENDIRYQYGFTLTAERIHEEWLLVFKTAKAQRWFIRQYNPNTKIDEYNLGTHLAGQRKLWQESTRDNALFLSTAVQLNSDQLRPIFNGIVNQLVGFGPHKPFLSDYSIEMLKSVEGKQKIEDFLISADMSIKNINLVKDESEFKKVRIDLSTLKATELLNEESDRYTPKFLHETESGKAIFELADESLGTQQLFRLAGHLFDILKYGKVLIVDELDRSLHPHLVVHLIKMFHNQTLNPKGAQLFFSTHNTSFFNTDIFRRDQIWLIDKNNQQASILRSLLEFSPRKNEGLEWGYLMGRYGAIPLLKDINNT